MAIDWGQVIKDWGPTVIQAGVGLYGSNRAADAMSGASDDALRIQQQQFDRVYGDLAPYREVGNSALSAYARAMGLPAPQSQGYDADQPWYGNGNQALDAAGVNRVFQDVLGRDAEAEAVRHYTTQGSKVGEAGGGSTSGRIGGAVIGNAIAGPIGGVIGSSLGSKFGGGDDRKRQGYTYNQLVAEIRNSPEYIDKRDRGILPPWEDDQYSANYRGSELSGNRLAEWQQSQAGAPQGDDRYGGFYASPGYQFRKDEQLDAVNKNMAARGLFDSGARAKALVNYSGNVASDEFNNYMNRLASAAGIGQTATSQSAAYGNQTAGQIGNALLERGQARASGYLGAANTVGNAINNYQLYKAIGR